MKYVLVVGGGKVGSYLASLLIADGHTVRLIEGNRAEIPRLSKEFPDGVLIVGEGRIGCPGSGRDTESGCRCSSESG